MTNLREDLGRAVGSVAGHLSLDHNRGTAAELRRLDGGVAPAFFQMLDIGDLTRFGAGDADTRERQWAVILQALAVLAGQHSFDISFGAALATAGVSELRFMKLSRARGPALPPQLRSVVQRLSATRAAFNHADLAWFVLSDSMREEVRDRARRELGRHYFRSLKHQKG